MQCLAVLLLIAVVHVYAGTVKPGEIKGPVFNLCSDSFCRDFDCRAQQCSGVTKHLPSLTCIDMKGSYLARGSDTDKRGGDFWSIWPRIYYSSEQRQDKVVFDFYDTKKCSGSRLTYSKGYLAAAGSCRHYEFQFDDDPLVTYKNGMITYPEWLGTDKDPLSCLTETPTTQSPSRAAPTAAPIRIVEPGEISGPVVSLCTRPCIPYTTCRFEKCPENGKTRELASLTCTDVPGQYTVGGRGQSFQSLWTRVYYRPRKPGDISKYSSLGADRITHDFYTTKGCSGRRNTYKQTSMKVAGLCSPASFTFDDDVVKYYTQVVTYPHWNGTNPLTCGVDQEVPTTRPSVLPTKAPSVAPGSPTQAPSASPQQQFQLEVWEIVMAAIAGLHVFILFGYCLWRCCEKSAAPNEAVSLPLRRY